jgi:hypothetical protein
MWYIYVLYCGTDWVILRSGVGKASLVSVEVMGCIIGSGVSRSGFEPE